MTRSRHARWTFWTSLASFVFAIFVLVNMLYSPSSLPLPGLSNRTLPSLLDEEYVWPVFPEDLGIILLFAMIGNAVFHLFVIIAWAAYRLLLRHTGERLRTLSLLAVNAYVFAITAQMVALLVWPDLTYWVTFGVARQYTQPYQTMATALAAATWAQHLAVFAFISICLIAIFQRVRRALT